MKNNDVGSKPTGFLMPLLIVMSLMFFWNMSRNVNDVLIPHLKRACQLTDFQSSLVQSAFFGAYFLVALPAGWYIGKKGYRAGMVTGLLISALGACVFYPAAETRYYPLFLLALFIMAAGFALLEVTASPYISKLGDPAGASGRLSLSAAIGSVGATIAPYLASLLLLHKEDIPQSTIAAFSPAEFQTFLSAEADLVKLPYISLAVLFGAMALTILFTKLPDVKDGADGQGNGSDFWEILRFRHTLYGVGAEFFYVGAEVGIVSFIIRYAKSLHLPDLTEQKAALFITAFMGLVLVGRLCGAYLLNKIKPENVLVACSCGAFGTVAAAIFSQGYVSLCCLSATGFFTSVIYPIIFSLSIKDLGRHTKTASSVFLLGIVGGAIVPPVMGMVSDYIGIKNAFLAPMMCYLYLLFFGWKGHRVG